MARVKAEQPVTLAAKMNADGDRRAQMAAVAARFSGSRPAYEVLRKVRGVRTIFPYLDLVTKIGGWPIERPTLVHGKSNEGKTLLGLGLGKSFLEQDHFFHLVDAEHTTEHRWLKMLSVPNHPGFSAIRPDSYESAVESVDDWATKIGNAREKGDLPPDITGICLVDSIGKLSPQNLMKEMFKAAKADEEERKVGKKGIDGAGGRSGQILAKMNNAWMNRLVPLMGHTGCCIVIITREYENDDTDPWAEEFVVAGGKNINYDSSLTVRVSRAGYISQGEGANKEIFGERHKVAIRKTKIARKEDKRPEAFFNSSNGVLVPAGFDTARDYLETAIEIGLVEQKGSHFVFGNERLGQGAHNVVKMLNKNETFFAELRKEVRNSIDKIIAQEPGEAA
jgi:recombination protein RecA